MIDSNLVIPNPKNSRNGIDGFYRYYAAYSAEFAQKTLSQIATSNGAIVVDPWNGSGTTTAVASDLGLNSVGLDLNPVSIIISHARFASQADATRVVKAIDQFALNDVSVRRENWSADDLLNLWFTPKGVRNIRSAQKVVQNSLQHKNTVITGSSKYCIRSLPLSLFQLVLFRTVRRFAKQYFGSNPTWISTPRGGKDKVDCSSRDVIECLASELSYLAPILRQAPVSQRFLPRLQIAESQAIPMENGSADVVLTSPPYCTRIDYAMATKLELAVLGLTKLEFSKLRRKLMGSTLTEKTATQYEGSWGLTCIHFLDQAKKHPSKASSTYYYRGFLRYFADLFASLVEISRIMIHNGSAVIVVRDSYYKNLRIDLSLIVQEMCQKCDLTVVSTYDFDQRSFGAINYRSHTRREKAVETVLIASKW